MIDSTREVNVHRGSRSGFRPIALLFVLVASALVQAAAAVPSVINYQGRLTDNTPQQTPLNGTVTMEFSLWDAQVGGASLWSETRSVSVVGGLFNVILGEQTPVPPSIFTGGAERYLEIHVSGETLTPRQRIAAAPFAHVAASADDAASLGGSPASSYQQRIAQACPAGFAVNAVAADGTVTCILGPEGPAGPAGPAGAPGAQGPPGPGLETASIIGSANACGPPVAKSLVQIPGKSFIAYTAGDGGFALSHVPAGTHSISIEAPGYAPVVLPSVNAVSGQQTDTGSTNVVDLNTSLSHCGSCNAACSTNHIAPDCAAGSCQGGVCAAGFGDCNSNKRTDGCEQDTAGSAANCGGCDLACSTNHVNPACANSSCQPGVCTPGFADCNNNKRTDGCEINITNDNANCAVCGRVCSTNNVTPQCTAGQCQGACNPGFDNCNANLQTDGCETNLNTSVQHCGQCGHTCSSANATPSCSGGLCTGTCNSGFADCNGNFAQDGCEINIFSSTQNCGGCAQACSTNHVNPICTVGSCQDGVCHQGFVDCNNNKRTDGCETNVVNDPNNCGACGHVCNAGQVCVGSVCS